MEFFNWNAKKQREALLAILPDANAIIDLMKKIYAAQSGGEKAKKARAARLNVMNAETLALNGDEAAVRAAEKARVEAVMALEEANEETTEKGFAFLQEIVSLVLNAEYDRALRVLAVLDGTTVDEIEESNDIFGLIDKGIGVITNEKILRFFPQLRRLATETQSDI